MFCRHVFGNISGGFRGISRKYLNFAGPRPCEISEALLIIIKTYKVIPGIKRPHFNDLFSFFNWETRNSSQLVDWTVIEEWKYGGHFFIFIVLIITIVTDTSAVYNCSKKELTSINKLIHQPLQQDTSLPQAIKQHNCNILSFMPLTSQSVSETVCLSIY